MQNFKRTKFSETILGETKKKNSKKEGKKGATFFQMITKRMMDAEKDDVKANNWKFAAIVVDRLCLYIFTIFIIASSCGILLSAPYFIA